MDKILYNGNFHTLDKGYKEASAVAIKDGIIIRIGSDDEILPLKDDKTEVIDLKGNTVLPGLMDTHMHLYYYSVSKQRVNLTDIKDFAEAKALLGAKVPEARKNGGWVMGRNFNQVGWPDLDRMPNRHDLDAIADDVPIYMQRACGHIVCLNTKALQEVGLWDEPKDTKHIIDFGEDGRPNGYVREHTGRYVAAQISNYTKEDIKNFFEESTKDAASKGLTQLNCDDFNIFGGDDMLEVLEAYKEASEEGRMYTRVVEQCRFSGPEQFQKFLDNGYHMNDIFGMFKIGPIKYMADGSIGSFTAAMRKPYVNNPDTKGILIHEDEEVYNYFKMAFENGFPVVTHCIGDAALEQICNALDRVQKEVPVIDNRSGIVHCQIMDDEQRRRFKTQNLMAYVQPIFVKADSKVVDAYVGPELAKQSYNWRGFAEDGVIMCGGSDCPVEPFDPLPNIFHAVTRKAEPGGEPWYPENALTIDEAVKMFTKDAAYATYDENRLGTISVGKYADMVVLDRDIYEIDPDEIPETQVLMTMVAGRETYRK